VLAALKCGYQPMGSNSGGKWGWGGSSCWGGDMSSNSWGQCWGGSSVNFWEQKPGTYSPCPAGSYKPYPGEACCQCGFSLSCCIPGAWTLCRLELFLDEGCAASARLPALGSSVQLSARPALNDLRTALHEAGNSMLSVEVLPYVDMSAESYGLC